MSGGESDAVRYIPVTTTGNTPTISNLKLTTNANTNFYSGSTTWPTSSWYTTYPYIYKYQIKCPAKTCKKMNWLELDKITPCVKCGLKLKAVAEIADFEIAIKE